MNVVGAAVQNSNGLATYADVFEYVCDGCYFSPGYKPGAASYDPGDDPVSIAYAIVLG